MERKKVFMIAVLVSVSFLSGTLATTSAIAPSIKIGPPTLHTQVFSDQLQLTVKLVPCPKATVNGTIISDVPAANFTVSLAGRDPGATFVTWNFLPIAVSPGVVSLYGPDANQTTVCSYSNNAMVAVSAPLATVSTQSLIVRIIASGVYTLVGTVNTGDSPLSVKETWTVTTIS